jgi:signal transduction histidine kinase
MVRPEPPLPGGLLCPWRRRGDPGGFLLFGRSSPDTFSPEEIEFCRRAARQLADILPAAPAEQRPARTGGDTRRFFHRAELGEKIKTLNLLSRSISYEQALLSSILTGVTEAIVVSDSLGNIILANSRARQILRLTSAKLREADIFSLLTELSRLPAGEIRRQFFPREEANDVFPREIEIGPGFYLLSLTRIGGEGEVTAGMMIVLSDITHLKQLEKLRTDTVSILTHEIKNPLAGILGYCELLMEQEQDPAEISEDLKLIHLSARKIHQLVSDYLEVARLESGREQVTMIPIDLEALIKEEITLLLPAGRQKGIRLESDLRTPLPEFRGDLNLLDRAFTNLISNAIKYSPSGKTVRVVLSHQDDSFVFQVRDSGFGIPPEDREKIFEKFYRGRNSRITEIPGTGLGLTITKEIIGRHGGRISVESAPGGGSIFTVILPDNFVGSG